MKELVIVYNTRSGIVNQASDLSRRLFTPEKQRCALRRLTFGPLGMRSEWRTYVRKLDMTKIFLLEDQLEQRFPKAFFSRAKDLSFPCMLIKKEKKFETLVSAEEIAKCESMDLLIDLVTQRVLALPKS